MHTKSCMNSQTNKIIIFLKANMTSVRKQYNLIYTFSPPMVNLCPQKTIYYWYFLFHLNICLYLTENINYKKNLVTILKLNAIKMTIREAAIITKLKITKQKTPTLVLIKFFYHFGSSVNWYTFLRLLYVLNRGVLQLITSFHLVTWLSVASSKKLLGLLFILPFSRIYANSL